VTTPGKTNIDIGQRRPLVGGRIVDLVHGGVAAAPADAADCMDLPSSMAAASEFCSRWFRSV
jgi:hypothetical protein